MSKAKISPWPWKIYPTHNKIEIQDANAQPVAVVWSGEMRYGGHSKSRYMNARLLALAPKLLEECGNALRVLCRLNNPDVGCTCHTDGHYCAACTTRDLETIVACASEVPDVFTVDPWCHKETHDCRAIDPAGDPTLTPGEGEKPAAKPEAKPADVPVVDAVWVDHEGTLYQYASHARAEQAWGERLTNGTARIVRIRSDGVDDDSIKNISDVLYRLDKQVQTLESRLAAEKPADKPAARVVKAPKLDRSPGTQAYQFYSERDFVWREALASQGFTIAAEGSKT